MSPSQIADVRSLGRVLLFVTPWTAGHQAFLSFTISRRLLKLTFIIKSVIPSNRLILCHPLLLLPSIFSSIRLFFNESALRIRGLKYWSQILQNKGLGKKVALNQSCSSHPFPHSRMLPGQSVSKERMNSILRHLAFC